MPNRSVSDYMRRYVLLMCGLFVMAVGVALSIRANMGISPISCLPYVLNQVNSTFTVGQYTAVMHIVFVLLQILLLRRQFALFQLLQLAVAVMLGLLIDMALLLLSFVLPANYMEQWLLFALSAVVVSFGMYLEIKANVLMVAGEGLVKAIATVTRREFSGIKITTDCALVAVSLLLSSVYLDKIVGIREGTVLAAIMVGAMIKFFSKHIRCIDRFLATDLPAAKRETLETISLCPEVDVQIPPPQQ